MGFRVNIPTAVVDARCVVYHNEFPPPLEPITCKDDLFDVYALMRIEQIYEIFIDQRLIEYGNNRQQRARDVHM